MSDDDLDLSGDSDDDTKAGEKKKSTRPRPSASRAGEGDLTRRIQDGLDEVAEFFERKFQDPELAGVIRDDTKRMAEVLAYHAAGHERVKQLVLRLFGKGSIVAIARAFGPTLRALGGRLRDWRDSRAEEVDLEAEEASDGTFVVPPA